MLDVFKILKDFLGVKICIFVEVCLVVILWAC